MQTSIQFPVLLSKEKIKRLKEIVGEFPKFGKLLLSSIETWENYCLVTNGDFGVQIDNESIILDRDFVTPQTCLLGAACLGKKIDKQIQTRINLDEGRNKRPFEEVQIASSVISNYDISLKEFDSIWSAFDGDSYNENYHDRKAFDFSKRIREVVFS